MNNKFFIKENPTEFIPDGVDSLIGEIESNHDFTSDNLGRTSSLSRSASKIVFTAGVMLYNFHPVEANELNFFEPQKSHEEILCDYNELIDAPFLRYLTELNDFVFLSPKHTKEDMLTKIMSFKSLQHSWDGYGAIPLEVESATNAVKLIYSLKEDVVGRIEDIFPNPNGTVSFLWENTSGERVSLEIGNHTFSYYIKQNSQKPLFFNNLKLTPDNIAELSKSVKSL
jgi:hypothetical protein